MCFGIEMSAIFAVSGLFSNYFLKTRGMKFSFYFPIAYFSIMEIFQSIQYFSIRHNLYDLNVLTTMLSYIHICFQPLFFNMFQCGYKNDNERTYTNIVYPLCILGGLGMLLRLKHFSSLYDHLYEYFLNMHTIDTCSCNNYGDYFESKSDFSIYRSRESCRLGDKFVQAHIFVSWIELARLPDILFTDCC